MNTSIKQILFPTDFSDSARKALRFVAGLAKRAGAKLILVHSIEEHYEFAPLPEEVRSRIKRKARLLLQDMKEEITGNDEYSDLEIDTAILNGGIVSSVLEEVNSNSKVDVIAMSTHGATGLKKMIFGSNTSEIILHSRIPVLTIPEDGHKKPENIIYATDYRDGDVQAIQEVTKWAKLYDAAVKVVHIADHFDLENDIKFRGFRELCKENISYRKMTFDLVIEYSFYAGITAFLEKNPDSMLAMTHYRNDSRTPLFRKSESKDLSCYTKVPLLVLIDGDV